jgi:cobalt-zinc-cadmium efflux system protein
VVILWGTWGLLRDSVGMALHGVPREIDATEVETMLCALPGVTRVHDLHIWPMSTRETALTAHLVMPEGHPGDEFLIELQHELDHDFGIGHATVQIEIADGAECRMHGNHHG